MLIERPKAIITSSQGTSSDGGGHLKRLFVLALLVTFTLQILPAIDLPTPPPGFTWQEVPELKAAFLRPTGWFFKREEQKGTLAYFITEEDIAKNGEFQTGLTVNVFHLKKDPAVDRAKDMIDQLANQKHGEKWSREFGPFREFGLDCKDTDATGTAVIHYLTVANPKTNTLYLFIFESPEASWNEAWKFGKQIMDNLALDDEV